MSFVVNYLISFPYEHNVYYVCIYISIYMSIKLMIKLPHYVAFAYKRRALDPSLANLVIGSEWDMN